MRWDAHKNHDTAPIWLCDKFVSKTKKTDFVVSVKKLLTLIKQVYAQQLTKKFRRHRWLL